MSLRFYMDHNFIPRSHGVYAGAALTVSPRRKMAGAAKMMRRFWSAPPR